MAKEIEISIKLDGTIDFDQLGFEGKDCHGAIDDIIKSLGDSKKVIKKQDYYKKQKIRINQRNK